MYTLHCLIESGQQRLALWLVLAVVLACLLLVVRVVGAVVFYFTRDLSMSPVSGTWGFRVGLGLVPEVLAACVLLAGGLATRNVREEGCGAGRRVGGEQLGSRGS